MGKMFLLFLLGSSLPAMADAYTAVPVPLVTLYVGDTLTAGQIGQRRYRTDWLARNQFARDNSEIAGLTVKRTLIKGRPIALADLGPESLVTEGDMITAIYAGGSLQIAAQMMALDSGSDGATVRLRNPESGAIVQGRVAGFARVVVGP
jgi:flagellar basal body P-ring formation protein FlgA